MKQLAERELTHTDLRLFDDGDMVISSPITGGDVLSDDDAYWLYMACVIRDVIRAEPSEWQYEEGDLEDEEGNVVSGTKKQSWYCYMRANTDADIHVRATLTPSNDNPSRWRWGLWGQPSYMYDFSYEMGGWGSAPLEEAKERALAAIKREWSIMTAVLVAMLNGTPSWQEARQRAEREQLAKMREGATCAT